MDSNEKKPMPAALRYLIGLEIGGLLTIRRLPNTTKKKKKENLLLLKQK